MTEGLIHQPGFVSREERAELLAWLAGIHPLWEDRHRPDRPLRDGQRRRRLLRPVYWLGGWQFACLDYYQPPDRVRDRVVAAEPFPDVLARLVARIEDRVSARPPGWRLNTCLVNFYGLALREGRWVDSARLGAHRDHEPGPVASLSLGAPARFQFCAGSRSPIDEVVWEHRLEDRSLLVFEGAWKELYHRVPTVSRGEPMDVAVEGFRTRRVNFTLRYVPDEWVVPFAELGAGSREAVSGYVAELARGSSFWAAACGPGALGWPQCRSDRSDPAS